MRCEDVFRQAIRPLRAYRLRTALTLLAIAIAVSAVISLWTLMQSAAAAVTQQVEGLGSNLVVVSINPPVRGKGLQPNLSLAQAGQLVRVPGISLAAPVDFQTAIVSRGGRELGISLYGTAPSLIPILGYQLAYGRGLTPADLQAHLNTIVLGAAASRHLFGSADPVGQVIFLNGSPYVVVGALAAKGAFLGLNQDTVAMVPITTYQDQNQFPWVNQVYLSVSSTASLPSAVEHLKGRLDGFFHDSNRYSILTQAEILTIAGRLTSLMTRLLVGVAGISIVVGGIGMLNVLLISVNERVVEIGVRKSVGADRGAILVQFLTEAVLLTLAGGLVGVGIGLAASYALTRALGLVLTPAPALPAAALAGSVLLGVVFGLYPAWLASRWVPAEALRCD
jgi:putative ABC transport system permease protein